MSGQQTPYIRLIEVYKHFDLPDGRFTALDNINIDFYQGEFASVVGRSGSGKSTLMNMITGIDRPSSGKIEIEGREIQGMKENDRAIWRGKNLGIVFQFYQLIPVLNLLENIMLPMQLLNQQSNEANQERAIKLLSMVQLSEYAESLPHQVSGGQQQCAAIARAMANDPAILIADEPTGNLSAPEAEMIMTIFQSLVEQNKTIIMVTHDDDLAAKTQRILRLSDGRVIDDSQNTQPLAKLQKKKRKLFTRKTRKENK